MKYTSNIARVNRDTATALNKVYKDINRALVNAEVLQNIYPDVPMSAQVITSVAIVGRVIPAIIVEHVRAMGLTVRIRASRLYVIANV